MRNAYALAHELDALRIVLRQENEAPSEEHEPHQCRNESEDVIERQECEIVDIELCVVLNRLVSPDDISAHLDLKADRLSAVAYYLGLGCRTGRDEDYLVSPVDHGLVELNALALFQKIFY